MKLVSAIVVAVVALLAAKFPVVGQLIGLDPDGSRSKTSGENEGRAEGRGEDSGLDELMRAYESQRSDVFMTVAGTVVKSLPDDNDDDRHQKFIVRFANGHTLLVAHNIDLAPRVPLREGDQLQVRGVYEWSAQGGVLHWTHHDPMQRHPEGWIRHEGQTYE